MRIKLIVIFVLLISANSIFGAITGLQIGLHNLIDNKWRNPRLRDSEILEYSRTGWTVGLILPINKSENLDFNFKMKLANHSINTELNPNYYYEYRNLFLGSNEFLIGKRIKIVGQNVLPQIGFGFMIDYFNGDFEPSYVYGFVFYDISISLLSIFKREALGLTFNYEHVFSEGLRVYPDRRFLITTLFFK